ncbi:MAG: inorganic phosphate transporter [Pseudodesulfovibrio sp.]|uniref:Phosphate transporter n=1 Tax=Pseudodesulfovibrio aespoeensis (strain ATCC 700646 / DSM 10631 / Aspo-2) TaxID=643562 RepID=E6VRA9_PSEA9|nr:MULTISPECIES: inorganic phosphate transporter [Pseudodesulfovibrio]MBU4476590.1 inorganic phosphate transporter [Pseudomonadota bacterium]ADU61838.1 phosphate transporter [Pseudodesulfovibrio aespoeensis Aspo-2]MBU4515880.1 inorganic phosphate transporter [Pseudomonadota bacterium]MBU4520653.1 inorganic phosphate transporter [Pseudomonadota bacterium]MBU4557751.1 inorganic phosphate transporter [Pseudomonadota bacterium]
MDIYDLFFYLSLGAGFLMAFNLGANDVANSMASAVGARAISVRQAVFIASILNFVGAVFMGSHVTATVSKGIINSSAISDPKLMMIGMFSALLAAALWVLVATLTSLPVSSTHSIVGAIMGFGLVAGGPDVVNWLKMGGIVLSWIISPFFAAIIAFSVFSHIRKYILYKHHFIEQAKRWAPIWAAFTILLIALSFLYKTPAGKSLDLHWVTALVIAAALGLLTWLGTRVLVGRMVMDQEEGAEGVERVFRRMQVGTSCYVALSQGANDVANAIGPVAAIYLIAKEHQLYSQADIPISMLILGGLGIAFGISLLGHKVMATVGEKITTLTNTRGFAVDFGAASTVLIASNLGLPVSTTHAAVGGVVGVGLARGFKAVDFRVLLRIVAYWVATVPIAALTSIIFFVLLKWLCYS